MDSIPPALPSPSLSSIRRSDSAYCDSSPQGSHNHPILRHCLCLVVAELRHWPRCRMYNIRHGQLIELEWSTDNAASLILRFLLLLLDPVYCPARPSLMVGRNYNTVYLGDNGGQRDMIESCDLTTENPTGQQAECFVVSILR
ncbi:hypothetical protein BD309DRAFT_108910 [Dichomitus squalens]|nr:hypothetical protein BD309DRAFT_108910 [Dichomitus squalens]